MKNKMMVHHIASLMRDDAMRILKAVQEEISKACVVRRVPTIVH